jgi:hypothetical protein
MDYNAAKRKSGEASKHKSKRKSWEAAKKLAAECDIDTKVFNKGLGPAWDKFVSYIKGAQETNSYVPVDARSFQQMKAAAAKVDPIIKGYQAIVKRNMPKDAKRVDWVAWTCLETQLGGMARGMQEALKIANTVR